ncbi:MAG: pantoate--beta-alanine ligase [Acidobacteriota bacterium]
MLLVTTKVAVRSRRDELARHGRRLAFVPTMGALHDGHLSIVRHARTLADEVWTSIFVNPTQFGPGEDIDRYPRTLERDRERLAAEGVALLFAPTAKEVYPRPSATRIDVPELAAGLCGAQRPGHFAGVALVVAKLLNIVQPHVAVFGAKDWQQATIVRRMTSDLDMPVKVVVAPTVREDDGLAMSSRNAYLDPEERKAATALHRALARAEAAVHGGERRGAALEALLIRAVAEEPLARLQYAAAVDPDTLAPVDVVAARVLLALAVHVGPTRLIDNVLAEVL